MNIINTHHYYGGLKIIFAGTSKLAYQHLQLLIKCKFNIIAVLTNKPYACVANLAKKVGILTITSFNLKNIYRQLIKLNPDLIIVISYGLIISEEILNLPKLGCINIHFSLLPRWRGAAPIQRAILANDQLTGISIIKMNKFLDDGNIIYSKQCYIHNNDTAKSLINKMLTLSLKGLIIILHKFLTKTPIHHKIQNNKLITYAKKVEKQEAFLNWHYPAIYLNRCIRAFDVWPGCFFYYKQKRIKVFKSNIIVNNYAHKFNKIPGTIISINTSGLKISTSYGILNITKLQLEGRNILNINDFLNSYVHKQLFTPGDIIFIHNNYTNKI